MAKFDLALAIAVLYAAGTTAITVAIIGWSESKTPWPTNLLAAAATAAAGAASSLGVEGDRCSPR